MRTTDSASFVELSGLVKRFGRHAAVESFTLSVGEGELVTFLGGSGCGKTTTLRMIAGFETPTAGTIRIAEVDIVHTPANRRDVGMVFQNYALFPTMTAAQNIAFGLKVRGMPSKERDERVQEMLSLIHMEGFRDRFPHQMSGGQQQRVALARALAVKPRVLLLDEPLSALDALIRLRLRAEIRSIQQSLGITTIYVTHDQEEALSLSDRVVVMRDGRIEQVGTPFEIYNRPATPFVASFIGSINVLSATVTDAPAGRVSINGEPIALAGPLSAATGSTVRLSLRPELISLQNGSPANNHLSATLSGVIFLGAIVRLVVRTGESEILVDTFNNPHLRLPARGDKVTLGFAPEACVPLGEGSTPDAPRGLASSPAVNRALIEGALGALYDSAIRLPLQSDDRIVVFSDLHMGDGGARDEFRPNGELMLTVLRDYYLARHYALVLNGDIEELQRTSLPSVRASWQRMYEVFSAFGSRSALYKIVGNHDARLRNDGPAAVGLLDALRLEVGGGTIFLFHGHQATIFFERFDWIADFFVRYVAKTLRIANVPVRYESSRRFVTERRVYEFSARRGILSIIGHTHRPLFESLSKIDSLKFRIEKLCREYPLASRPARAAIEKAIKACKAELKHLREKDARNGGRDSLYNETICIPCLFNSGCAIGKRGVTAIEITAERISLVHWYDSRRQAQSRGTAGEAGAPATRLRRTDFHRVVLKQDHLPYLFSRVRLLA